MGEEKAPSPQSFKGTILEAAFVDPAYNWPPREGEGVNAVELEASTYLLTKAENGDAPELNYPEKPKIKSRTQVITETETYTTARCGFFKCCRSDEHVVNTHTRTVPVDPAEQEKLKKEYLEKRAAVRKKRKERRDQQEKYARVPDGVLIYRLDTAQHTVSLISAPNSNTDLRSLMTDIVVIGAHPSKHVSRRGIMLIDETGEKFELVACDQRTATAWMEALNMMLGKGKGGLKFGKVSTLLNDDG